VKELNAIKKQFTPIQPTIDKGKGNVSYHEIAPDKWLENHIYFYWQLKTHQKLTETFFYRVVADGCFDVFWEAGHPDENFIMGFSNSCTEFPLESSFNYLGVRFLPTVFPILYKVDASELTNKFELLDNVTPNLSKNLSELTNGINELAELKYKLDNHFIRKIAGTDFTFDSRLYNAIDIILNHQGTLNIERDIEAGISPRQLRRLFKYYIGDSPKTFSKVVRFQNFLKSKPSKESLRKNKIFFDLGYYDQAHFVKEFKHLYGLPPTSALE